jgi:predicted nucleic acid-binding protein
MSEVSDSPTVLDTTVLSNFGYIDRVDLLEDLPRVCTVPDVKEEIEAGVNSYHYLQNSLDSLNKNIPVVELDSKEVNRLGVKPRGTRLAYL